MLCIQWEEVQVKIKLVLNRNLKSSVGHFACTFEMVPNFSSLVSGLLSNQALVSDGKNNICWALTCTTNVVTTGTYNRLNQFDTEDVLIYIMKRCTLTHRWLGPGRMLFPSGSQWFSGRIQMVTQWGGQTGGDIGQSCSTTLKRESENNKLFNTNLWLGLVAPLYPN